MIKLSVKDLRVIPERLSPRVSLSSQKSCQIRTASAGRSTHRPASDLTGILVQTAAEAAVSNLDATTELRGARWAHMLLSFQRPPRLARAGTPPSETLLRP